MKTAIRFFVFAFFASSLMFVGCKGGDDPGDPNDGNEEELITNLTLDFQDSASGNQFSIVFSDPDGTGGDAPTVFDAITLDANASIP